MEIAELLYARGLAQSAKVKLIRHQDSRVDVNVLWERGLLDTYQKFQSDNAFEKADIIVSFIGRESKGALLTGVYKILGKRRPTISDIPSNDSILKDICVLEDNLYDLEKIDGFDDIIGRVVIDWGNSTRSWFQWLKEGSKEVIEILPRGYVREFPGYLDFTLSYNELRQIIKNPVSNRQWHLMLAAVAGVYLIIDLTDGSQYVGSAYGGAGVLGRWSTYADRPHGDNKELIKLIDENPDRALKFQFTLLRTLPKTLSEKEVILIEALYKKKLGSRAFGLNHN